MSQKRHAFRPERALAHPLWVGALWLLVVNDHLLKGAGILPGWLTGKLSDLAGFLLLPMLLAVLVRARQRAALIACHAAAVVLLLLLELSPGLCAFLHRTLGLRLWADPTDLVAMVSIVVSYRVLVAHAAAPRPIRRTFVRSGVVFGALACAASSTESRPPLTSAVVLQNQSGRGLDVRLSAPQKGLIYDCALALRAPQELFRPEHFVAYEHVRLPAGDLLPLDRELPSQRSTQPLPQDTGPCRVRLLAVEGAGERLVVWDPQKRLAHTLSREMWNLSAEEAIVLEDGGPVNGPAEILRPGPSALPQEQSSACTAVPASTDPAWTEPSVQGAWQLRAIERGPDGCDLLTLGRTGFGDRRTMLCAEPLGVPFTVGDELAISQPDNATLLIERSRDRAALLLARGAVTSLAADAGACRPTLASCGVVINRQATIPTPAGLSPPLSAGQRIALSGSGWAVDLAVVRAEQRVLGDASCSDNTALSATASYVWIRRKE